MGKISEYNRQQFASTYVGAPAEDTSGSIAVAGMGKALTPMIEEQAKVLRERELVMIDQQANNALIKYSLEQQKRSKELEAQYADNPTAYPQAVTDMGTKLQEEFSTNIPDERVRARFAEAANTVVRQSSSSAFKWSEVKQEQNAYIAWNDSLSLASQKAAQQETEETFRSNLSSIAIISKSNILISPETQLKGYTTSIEEAKKGYFRNRAANDSANFEKEILDGKYDAFTFKDDKGKEYVLPLSGGEKQYYIDLARDSAVDLRARKEHEQLVRSEGTTRDLTEKYLNGDVGLAEVIAHQDEVNANPEATPAEKKNADTLAKMARTINRKEGVPDPSKLFEVQAEFVNLLKQAKRKGGGINTKYMTELIELNTRVTEYMNEGSIPETEGRNILKQLSPSVTQAITKGPSHSTPLAMYYDMIDAKVKNFPGLNDRQKKMAQAKAYNNFIARKMAVEAQSGGAKIEKVVYQQMVTDAVSEVTRALYPQTAAAEETPNAVASASEGATIISTNEVSERLRLSGAKKIGKKVTPPIGSTTIINGELQRATKTGWERVKEK